VDDHLFEPGWTDYNQLVMAQTVDVTKLLVQGTNALGAILSDGWFAGRVGWMGLYQYGKISKRPLFSAQLEITYADGRVETIATDETWKTGTGEIVGSDMQVGEILDARKRAAWDAKDFDDAGWSAATTDESIKTPIVPELGVPVRKLMEIAPQKISRVGDTWIVDLGQNMVGHVQLKAKGTAGTTILLRHGEMLNGDGTLYTENLRTAISMDKFTLRGDGEEVFEPEFTFHGFRYVEVTGYPGTLAADDVRGIVVGSDLPAAGTFECSDTNVNRLYENIVWGQRGNFLSVPTDCPQRDERMGWMGDAQVFAATAARNADVAAFFTKWLVDVDDAQSRDGEFSRVAPIANQSGSYPVWGDAGVIIPWEMYLDYGDKRFLADHYEHMARWVDFGERTSGTNLLRHGGVGDHLAPGVERGMNPTTTLVDTTYFARSAWIVSQSATLLGKTNDAAKYGKLFEDIVAAFDRSFVHEDGSMQGGTQTTYSLALLFDLLPENLRGAAAKHLADDVEAKGHLTTGFVGVGMINPALTSIGRSDLAWRLVLTDTYPSWLFTVKHGATTIWERWDGWTPEKGFEASSMNSFNHYSMGSVGAWFYSGAAGIKLEPAHPGYKHFTFAPQFTSRLDYVKASLESPYGTIKSAWHKEGEKMVYEVTVPPNSSAEVKLPVTASAVLVNGKAMENQSGATTEIPLVAGAWRVEFPKAAVEK
jgi:alpha-L-rhamnosidase